MYIYSYMEHSEVTVTTHTSITTGPAIWCYVCTHTYSGYAAKGRLGVYTYIQLYHSRANICTDTTQLPCCITLVLAFNSSDVVEWDWVFEHKSGTGMGV